MKTTKKINWTQTELKTTRWDATRGDWSLVISKRENSKTGYTCRASNSARRLYVRESDLATLRAAKLRCVRLSTLLDTLWAGTAAPSKPAKAAAKRVKRP
jgi:hypothetical protein